MLQYFRNLFSRPQEAGPIVVPESRAITAHIIAITRFIRRFPDQKLFDVLAFCQDGRMDYCMHCRCLLGVFSSPVLHTACNRSVLDPRHHYHLFRQDIEAKKAEAAYRDLGECDGRESFDGQWRRDVYLQEILRVELRDRAKEGSGSVRLIPVYESDLEKEAQGAETPVQRKTEGRSL